MNVRRGLARLWLIFSFVWIGGTLIAAVSTGVQAPHPMAGQLIPRPATAEGALVINPQLAARFNDAGSGMTDAQREVLVRDIEKGYIVPATPLRWPADQKWRRVMSHVAEYAGVAVGVPVGSFFLGWALLWIASGFRPRRASAA